MAERRGASSHAKSWPDSERRETTPLSKRQQRVCVCVVPGTESGGSSRHPVPMLAVMGPAGSADPSGPLDDASDAAPVHALPLPGLWSSLCNVRQSHHRHVVRCDGRLSNTFGRDPREVGEDEFRVLTTPVPHTHPVPAKRPRSRPVPVHILFVGAGAVGCFYASRLHQPSQNIYTSLTARSNYATIAASGVSLQTHTFGDYTFTPYAVFPSVSAAVPNSPSSTHPPSQPAPSAGWDYIVVTTKALPDRTDDAALIAPLVSANTCIVLIQNGVGVEEPYRNRFPLNPIVSAVTIISAEQIKQGVIRQNRWTRISLGPYSYGLGAPAGQSQDTHELTRRGHQCMQHLSHWWTTHGGIRDVETHTELELQTIRWHKLCINAAFNPTAVVSGGRGNADQLTDPELRKHITGIMNEVWNAAPKVLGTPLPASVAKPDKIIKSTERNPGAKPSMLLDWEAGRPMELEVILGNPIRIARRAGVEMPKLQTMYALLRSMQSVREANKAKEKL
ncbi:Uu.00g120930.m01.CDS01 [Anthostomella pinea]|uniref:Uu.00g120930.m01.CDS01 n=1 Tax=Anthostomella pinea TaxID=933095 RepID=A0AAI8VGU3_9PEZI|nr:Uu.00g120930.m01.CDS01 [Anthostomella pinea]